MLGLVGRRFIARKALTGFNPLLYIDPLRHPYLPVDVEEGKVNTSMAIQGGHRDASETGDFVEADILTQLPVTKGSFRRTIKTVPDIARTRGGGLKPPPIGPTFPPPVCPSAIPCRRARA